MPWYTYLVYLNLIIVEHTIKLHTSIHHSFLCISNTYQFCWQKKNNIINRIRKLKLQILKIFNMYLAWFMSSKSTIPQLGSLKIDTKGQLILKYYFGVFKSPKKTKKKANLTHGINVQLQFSIKLLAQ